MSLLRYVQMMESQGQKAVGRAACVEGLRLADGLETVFERMFHGQIDRSDLAVVATLTAGRGEAVPTSAFTSIGDGVLGVEHDVTLQLKHKLCIAYSDSQSYVPTGPNSMKWIAMVRELAATRERVSGAEHEQTLQVQAYLAICLKKKDD